METILSNLLGVSIPILEKIIRPILVYLFLVIGLRLAGKRELAQLNPFDLVVLLTISNTVQNAIIGADNSLLGGLIGATTLLVVNWGMVRLIHRNKKVEAWVEGKESYLIRRGVVQKDVLTKEEIDLMELQVAAHKAGIEYLDQVEKATLEPDGSIAFVKKELDSDMQRHIDLIRRIQSLETHILRLESELKKT
jgi:uncharacterized membrane protein YcaP (DUF421 family)